MKTKLLASILLALSLVGCASTEQQYTAYMAAHQAYAEAEAEKYRALAAMSRQNDPTAKALATVMLGGAVGGNQRAQIAVPESTSDKVFKWTSLFVPVFGNMYSIKQNANVAITNSNNAAATAVSTNNAFVGIASKIQAPGAITTTTYSNSYNQDYTHAPTVVQVPAPEVVVVPPVIQP